VVLIDTLIDGGWEFCVVLTAIKGKKLLRQVEGGV